MLYSLEPPVTAIEQEEAGRLEKRGDMPPCRLIRADLWPKVGQQLT